MVGIFHEKEHLQISIIENSHISKFIIYLLLTSSGLLCTLPAHFSTIKMHEVFLLPNSMVILYIGVNISLQL